MSSLWIDKKKEKEGNLCYLLVFRVGDFSQGWPKVSLFNSYDTEV